MASRMMMLTMGMMVTVCGVASSTQVCSEFEFYNKDLDKCQTCSVCPGNQVVLRLCYEDRDTECGNFAWSGKFEPLNTQKTIKETSKSPKNEEQPQQQSAPTDTSSVVTEADSEDRWFHITMVLVGALVLMAIGGVVGVFALCLMNRKGKQPEVIYDSCKYDLVIVIN